MKRRLFNFAAAGSLVLCLACVCMWVRSGYVGDSISIGWGFPTTRRSAKVTIGSSEGRVIVDTAPWREPGCSSYSLEEWSMQWDWPTYRRLREFYPGEPDTIVSDSSGHAISIPPTPMVVHEVVVTYWLLTLLSSILPALWLQRWKSKAAAARRRGFAIGEAMKRRLLQFRGPGRRQWADRIGERA